MAKPSPELVRLCAEDLLRAYKLERFRVPLALPAKAIGGRIARLAHECDRIVGAEGLVSGGHFLLERFASKVETFGAIPREGPVLLASNHPGMMDAIAIWTELGREDLKIIAAERDLLDHLPNIRERLLISAPGESRVLYEASAWLQQGGAILTFPAGKIEPDPDVSPLAVESLQTWSTSLMILLRRNPAAKLVPVGVRGCLNRDAIGHPLLRAFRDQRDRDWAAATLQILLPRYRKTQIRVGFGPPAEDFMALLHHVRSLIEAPQA